MPSWLNRMFKAIQRRLDLPFARDLMERRSAPFVQIILLIIGLYMPISGYVDLTATPRPAGALLPYVAKLLDYSFVTLASFISLWEVRKGNVRRGSRIFLVCLTLSMGGSYVTTGLRGAPVDLLPFLLMAVAGLALGRQALWTVFLAFAACVYAGIITDIARLGTAREIWMHDLMRAGTIMILYLVVAATLDQTICKLRDSIIESDRRELYLSQLSQRLQREIEAHRVAEERLIHSRKIDAVEDIAAGIAHDFGNVLNVIAGYAERRDDLAEEGVPSLIRTLAQVEAAVGRAQQLNRRLLDLSRKEPTRQERFDANQRLREIAPQLAQIFGRKVRVRLDMTDEPLYVMFDPAHLELIALNLAANARDAMSNHGGEFRVASSAQNGRACFSFSDAGTGMDEMVQQHLFEPFFTTKPPGKGTGLGLVLIRDLLRRANGTVTIRSKPGQGTTCEISLPLLATAADASRRIRLRSEGVTEMADGDQREVG
ncbi:HAMP domain-containing sensor histidine kinase [Rhodanobacter sp. PCA2]|uniref:sensor histidine kinase n=1 Tax=Rhodanobacter sp. PCA2 TaxID=2006117 RepID=UPI0015E67282|nr:HAMP domain-containing sensor histidine kinase [Rhodanobacter sp. PCA2]